MSAQYHVSGMSVKSIILIFVSGTSLSEQRSEVRFLDSASKEARFHDIQPSRDRMKTVINKIDFIFRSFQNADNRQNGTISVSFAGVKTNP